MTGSRNSRYLWGRRSLRLTSAVTEPVPDTGISPGAEVWRNLVATFRRHPNRILSSGRGSGRDDRGIPFLHVRNGDVQRAVCACRLIKNGFCHAGNRCAVRATAIPYVTSPVWFRYSTRCPIWCLHDEVPGSSQNRPTSLRPLTETQKYQNPRNPDPS